MRCEGLPDPARVFIGGSDGELEALLDLCWGRLVPGGILVASAVTDATRELLEGFCQRIDAESIDAVRLAVARSTPRTANGHTARSDR